jgi:hypothetical protein
MGKTANVCYWIDMNSGTYFESNLYLIYMQSLQVVCFFLVESINKMLGNTAIFILHGSLTKDRICFV